MAKIDIPITQAKLRNVEFWFNDNGLSKHESLTKVSYTLTTPSGKEVGTFSIKGEGMDKNPEIKQILEECAEKLEEAIADPINRDLKMIEAVKPR